MLNDLVFVFLSCALLVFLFMNLAFVVGLSKRNNSLVDIFWGLGFIFVSVFSFIEFGNYELKQILVTLLIIIWGARLAVHIYFRNYGRGEDFRYKNWRGAWGKYFYLRSYLQIYIIQGLLMIIIVSPIIIMNTFSGIELGILGVLGVFVWLIGFLFESIGDWQLRQFARDPKNKGKIMQSGLWKFTRHPNYFGEAILWWGIFLIAVSSGFGYLAIVSPVIITYLLVFVSGIPLLEKKYIGNTEFEKYKARTSAFFPWVSKK